jgi:hypothetical protein
MPTCTTASLMWWGRDRITRDRIPLRDLVPLKIKVCLLPVYILYESIHHPGVKMITGLFPDMIHGLFFRPGFPVGPIRVQRIPDIDNGKDTCSQRDLISF